MIRRAKRFNGLLVLAAALAVLSMPRPGLAAPGDPVMDYGVDIVSNYVLRGVDVFAGVYNVGGATPGGYDVGEAHGSFQFVPALQPSATFYGPGGLSFGIWASFALTERDTGGANLGALDEMDYTLAWDWSNRMGGFSTGLATYTTTSPAAHSAINEAFFKWSPKVMESLSPEIAHYVIVDAGGGIPGGVTYTSFAIGGGESLTWNASLGIASGIQDLTAGIGYGFTDSMSVSFNIAVRPDKALVGEGGTADDDFPSAVAWLTFSYSGAVKE